MSDTHTHTHTHTIHISKAAQEIQLGILKGKQYKESTPAPEVVNIYLQYTREREGESACAGERVCELKTESECVSE